MDFTQHIPVWQDIIVSPTIAHNVDNEDFPSASEAFQTDSQDTSDQYEQYLASNGSAENIDINNLKMFLDNTHITPPEAIDATIPFDRDLTPEELIILMKDIPVDDSTGEILVESLLPWLIATCTKDEFDAFCRQIRDASKDDGKRIARTAKDGRPRGIRKHRGGLLGKPRKAAMKELHENKQT